MKTSDLNRLGNRRYGEYRKWNEGNVHFTTYTCTVGRGISGWLYHKLWRRFYKAQVWLRHAQLEVIARDKTIVNEVYTVLERDDDVLKWLYENAQRPCTIFYSRQNGFELNTWEQWDSVKAAVYFSSKQDAAMYKLVFG